MEFSLILNKVRIEIINANAQNKILSAQDIYSNFVYSSM